MTLALSILFLFCGLLVCCHSSSHTLCKNSRLPTPLKICSYNKTACCDSAQDLLLQTQFKPFNVSNAACASLLKSILYAICSPLSAELFKSDTGSRIVPLFWNTRSLESSSHQSRNSISYDFCTELWAVCQNVLVANSPSDPLMHDKTKREINPQSSTYTKSSQPPEGICLEKLDNGAYVNMVSHPDGSNQVFLSSQQGLVWLATVPDQGSDKVLEIVESNSFLDITSRVVRDADSGLMGMAFHPNFKQNGRFFLSFICDKTKQLECSGRCSCNTDVNCDPSKLNTDGGVLPCQYQSVIAEFTANDTGSESSYGRKADIAEVRRILTMGLPSKGDHGGQILFGPDGYLYFMMGDSSRRDDLYNLAQSKKSLLGKIMRLDIDHIPSAAEIQNMGLWGNYSIPRNNPFADDRELAPEIWAMGFRNPWRCSFDSERPSYFLCGDCGQDQYEEVDRVIKGGNYGWHVYEGPYLSHPATSPGENTSTSSINTIFPVMGYNHSEIDKDIGSASIIGGYFYRSITDPCLYGRYLYMDLYGAAWAGSEDPENSGKFSSRKISYKCADDSPIQCSSVEGNYVPAIGYVFSFAEDNKKDVYILTSTGLYRIVRASRCSYECSKETREASVTSKPDLSSPISGILSSTSTSLISLLVFSFVSFTLHVSVIL